MEIDALLEFREIDERSVAEVFSLAPFGCGNPAPLFAALDVEVAGPPVVMKEKHLRVMLRQNGRTLMHEGVELRRTRARNCRPARAWMWPSRSKTTLTPPPAACPRGAR